MAFAFSMRSRIVDAGKRFVRPLLAGLIVAAGVLASAEAGAETRTLKLYYTHTGERAEVTFKRNGKYLSDGLKKANHMLRDWRRNEPTKMDPRVLDLLWEVYREAGGSDYIHVVSGYRSPATNAMLRKTRGGQAEKSQHMVGKAIDFFIPGVKLAKLRAIALRKQIGGVGYYPRSGSPFVHIDTGSVRHWPRMSRQELVAVFPNGKTLHVPSDGKPLPGYEQALAAYKKKGSGDTRTVVVDNTPEESSGKKPKTLLAALFGGADESEDEADVPAPVVKPVAVKQPVETVQPVQPVDIAALQPAPLEVQPETRVAPPAEIPVALEAAPEAVPAPEAAPVVEFAALPNAGAPVPTANPRRAPALTETEIAALADVEVAPEPRPETGPTELAALAPVENPANTAADNPFDALLPADGLAPSQRPEGKEGRVEMASLAPVPETAPRQGRVLTPALAPAEGKSQRVSKPSPATVAAIAPAVTTKTTGKTRKLPLPVEAPVAAEATGAVVPLPVDSNRFGPRADGDAQAVDDTTTAALPEKKGAVKAGGVLADGSTLVKTGKIPVLD